MVITHSTRQDLVDTMVTSPLTSYRFRWIPQQRSWPSQDRRFLYKIAWTLRA